MNARLSSSLRFEVTIVENVHFQRKGCDWPGSHWRPDSVGRDSAWGWQVLPTRVAVTLAVVRPQKRTEQPIAMSVMPQMVVEIAGRV